MDELRIVKVQTPALRLRALGREWRFGAHNFVAVMTRDGVVTLEMHGVARGADGAQLPIYGGVVPFRREYIRGEVFEGRTGFYDPSFPQGDLLIGNRVAIERRLGLASAVRAQVNARRIRYPWPATSGANSNAYYATLVAGMGLSDTPLDGELWAPSVRRRLLPDDVLAELARPTGGTGPPRMLPAAA